MENEQTLKLYSELPNQVLNEINKIRTDPKSYIPVLEDLIKTKFELPDREKVMTKSDGVKIELMEGKSALQNALEFLKNQEPLSEVELNSELSQAATDHLTDIGVNSLFSHVGSDGSSCTERVEKYVEWDLGLAENVTFGESDAKMIVVNFLVDDGNQTRNQRNNLFNDEFKYVGISCGDHFSQYKNSAVLVFAIKVRGKGSEILITENEEDKTGQSSHRSKMFPANNGYESSRNHMQNVDTDAPDDAVTVKYYTKQSTLKGDEVKVTQKIYTLKDGSQHIVEVVNKVDKKKK